MRDGPGEAGARRRLGDHRVPGRPGEGEDRPGGRRRLPDDDQATFGADEASGEGRELGVVRPPSGAFDRHPRRAAGPSVERLGEGGDAGAAVVAARHGRLAEGQVDVDRSRGAADARAPRRPPGPSPTASGRRRRAGPRAPRARGTSARRGRRGGAGRSPGWRRCRAAPADGPRSAAAAARRRCPPRPRRGGGSPPPSPRSPRPRRAGRSPRASPTARNPADRSSTSTCRRKRGSSWSAIASAADRDPGREHRVGHAAAGELVDQHERQRVRGVLRPVRQRSTVGPPVGEVGRRPPASRSSSASAASGSGRRLVEQRRSGSTRRTAHVAVRRVRAAGR